MTECTAMTDMTVVTVVTVGYPKKCILNVKFNTSNKNSDHELCILYTETPQKRVLTQS